jgi:hypothetical protein
MESSITWKAYEYITEPKTADWYWALGVISLALAGASLIFGNYIFSLLVIVIAVALAIHAHHHEPRLITVTLSERGVRLDHMFYPYKTLESFDIETHETEVGTFAKIFIKSRKTLMPLIVIPLTEAHPEDVRDYLSIFLEEGEHMESFGHRVLEWLGF